MSAPSRKREADGPPEEHGSKRNKAPHAKKWRTPKSRGSDLQEHDPVVSIETGDAGIWATCDRGREAKCVGELRDLLEKYAHILYGDDIKSVGETEDDASEDIERSIRKEVAGLKSADQRLFTAVRLDIPCVLFFKTSPPIDPVGLVHRIVLDAVQGKRPTQGRFIKRLSPMTRMAKAYEREVELLARSVLAPHFHEAGCAPKKFAIRTTIRNHNRLDRDTLIRMVADIVGPDHSVDLKHYDCLILVEVYKNLCGMSLVGSDYDQLKRYNLAEISYPTAKTSPRPAPASTPGESK